MTGNDNQPPAETAGHAKGEPPKEALPPPAPEVQPPMHEPEPPVPEPEPRLHEPAPPMHDPSQPLNEPLTDQPPPPFREPPPPKRDSVPWLYGLGLLVLAVALIYLWQNPSAPPNTASTDQLNALDTRLTALENRVAQIQQQAAALPPRIAALEARPAGGSPQLTAEIAALSTRLDSIAGHDQASATDLNRQIAAQTDKMATLEKAASQVSGLADRATKLARLQAAGAALAAGQPLGDIPGAPPALAKYAATPPPTEGALRLAYPAAENAALSANGPDIEGKPFLQRMLARAEELVTIRQGDHVIVGSTAAGILARASTALNAGDLPAAVAAVSELQGPAASAMANWLAQAKSLLAARAALADLAAHA